MNKQSSRMGQQFDYPLEDDTFFETLSSDDEESVCSRCGGIIPVGANVLRAYGCDSKVNGEIPVIRGEYRYHLSCVVSP